MSSLDGDSMTDAKGRHYDHWLSKVVETPHGVGDVVAVDGDIVHVTHEFPTHGRINGEYRKGEVAVVDTPQAHPAYGPGSGYRRHDYEDLEAMEEPTIHL